MEKIIIDTDIGNDCDDMGALALCHKLCDNRQVELLAVTACLSTPYAAGCIDAVNRYYNRVVPIGENFNRKEMRLQYDEGGCTYDKIIFESFNNSYKENRAEESLSVLRKALANADDNSVTIVGLGYLSNMARLIESQADEISSFSGAKLVAKKVKKTVIMGGNFAENSAEFNIKKDIGAAKTFFEKWVGEIILSPFEIGNKIITLKGFCKNRENPVGLAYDVYPWGGEKGRESWDLTAVLYAVREDLWNLSNFGRVTVDDKGITLFEENKDFKHRYLISKNNEGAIEELIDSIVK